MAVNSNYIPSHTVPFGGSKESGNGGREAGHAGLMSCLEAKTIVFDMKVGSS